MQDFFRQYRDNWESRPEPLYEARDWQALEQRLDQQRKVRPVGFFWWWLALPLLFLSLASNVLFYTKWQKAAQERTPSAVAAPQHTDTVYRTQVVFRTDTIYQTRFVVETQRTPLPESVPVAVGKAIHGPAAALLLPAGTMPDTVESPATVLAPLSLGPCSLLKTVRPVPAAFSEVPFLPKKRKRPLRDQWAALQPRDVRLGVSGAVFLPLSAPPLDVLSAYALGGQASVDVSPAFRLWAEVMYATLDVASDQMGDSFGIPVVDPPSDDHVFLKAELPQSSLQYALGVQYFLRRRAHFRPFLGAGIAAVSLLPAEISYDFRDKSLGVEWTFENPAPVQRLARGHLLLRAGFEQRLTQRWQWQLLATYRSPGEKTNIQRPAHWGLQAGLLRRF